MATITCTAYDPNNDPLSYTWTTGTGTINGTGSQVIWSLPLSAGTYTITCEVSNGKAGTSSSIATVSVTNQPPIISSLTASPTTLAPGGTTTITCTAYDPNNDPITYTWTTGTGTINGTGSQVVWSLPLSAGTYTITCEVSDGKAGTSSSIATVSVTNQPPVIGSLTANPTTLASGGTTTITCTAYDPNNDPLSYTWTTGTGTINGTGSQVVWSLPLSAGTYTITCEVSDGKAGTSSSIATVSVTNQPPVISSLTASPTTLAPGGMATITCIAYDPNDDLITYTWTIGTGTLVGTGSQVVWTAPLTPQANTITCTVSDENGGTTQKDVIVYVDNKVGWAFVADSYISSSPAIGTDNTIYIGSGDNKLYAINSVDGTKKWEFLTGDVISSSPAIGTDGTIYVGSWDGYLYAINPNGFERWRFGTIGAIYSSPAIGTDGTIYIGSFYDYNLYAIAPNGSETWKVETGAGIYSSPAIGIDGTIYVGSYDFNLYAIAPNGTITWKFPTNYCIKSSPAIGTDGTIYVGSRDGYFYAIAPNGSETWKFSIGGNINSSPVIGTDGTIYVGADNHNLYAINPSGTKVWEFTAGGAIDSAPAIGNDGTIYIGSGDNNIYAINSNGTEKWRFVTGGFIYSSPAIWNGKVYIGSYDHRFYAITCGETLANTPCPMFHYNLQHTGRLNQ